MFIAAKENLKQRLTPSSRVIFHKLIIAQLVKKLIFIESQGSLPYSQEPAAGPYPKTDVASTLEFVFNK
jgi:hypothetical protein